MQRNAYKKAIGERIQQLRKGLRKEGFNGQPKTVNEFLEFLNPKIDDDYDNYGDYSLTDIEFSYKKDYVSKVEHGIVFPSTDFLFLIHLRFNVSLDYLVFGHNLPEIEELRKICKHSGKSKINDFCFNCFNLLEGNSKYIEDFDDEDEDFFLDYRARLDEVRKYFCNHQQRKLTQKQFSELLGVSKNTMDKYHSKKSDVQSKKYAEIRNTALEYLIRFSLTTKCSLDYLLYGTYLCEGFPCGISELLRGYDYAKQTQILKLWLEETKKFFKNSQLHVFLYNQELQMKFKINRKEIAMDIKNAKIDVLGSVGSKLLLIDVIPSYAYVDGRRTSTVTGYKYIVILEENKFDRLSVRIDGDKQIDNPIDGNSRTYVRFDNLELSLYWTSAGHQIAAKASAIHLVNESLKPQK